MSDDDQGGGQQQSTPPFSGRDAIAHALMVQQHNNQQNMFPNPPARAMTPDEYERHVQDLKNGGSGRLDQTNQWSQQFHDQMNQQQQPGVQPPLTQPEPMPTGPQGPPPGTVGPDGETVAPFASQMMPSFEDQWSGGDVGI